MKKKILAMCLVVAMLAIAVTGATLAYFSDTAAQTNTFTAGKVGISLDEAVVAVQEGTDNLVATGGRTDKAQEYKLHPGIVVDKDPTITMDADSENAYVAAIVTVKGDLYDLIGVKGYDNINIHGLVSGGLVDQEGAQGTYHDLFVYQNDNYAIHQIANKEAKTWTLYVFMKNEQTKDSDPIKLFEKLEIPAKYNNDEMAKINGMSIKVEAYAAQVESFADCYAAMKAAFADAFAAV